MTQKVKPALLSQEVLDMIAAAAGGGGSSEDVAKLVRNGDVLEIDPYSNFYIDIVAGSDTTGDGTSGNPWKTFDYAYQYVASLRWEAKLGSPTLILAEGSYTSAMGMYEGFHSLLGSDSITIKGSGSSNTTIDFGFNGFYFMSPYLMWLQNIKIKTATSVRVSMGANLVMLSDVVFHLDGLNNTGFEIDNNALVQFPQGGTITHTNNTQQRLIRVRRGGKFLVEPAETITLSTSVAYGVAFAEVLDDGLLTVGVFGGSATITGMRVLAKRFARISTNGVGETAIPGTVASSLDASCVLW